MRRNWSWIIVVLYPLLHICSSASEPTIDRTGGVGTQKPEEDDPTSAIEEEETQATTATGMLECGIWLAPSTLVGAGLGMFAGKSYKKGQFLQSVGDLCIPLIDVHHHNNNESFSFLWQEYTWNAQALGIENEGLYEVHGASPGFGSAANSFLPLVNVEELHPIRDFAGLHRSKDPGVGAFTPYFDRKSEADRDIRAGEEFFVSYGEAWFQGRKFLGPIPLTRDLDRATILYRGFSNMKRRLASLVPSYVFDELWDTFVHNSTFNSSSRVLGAFRREHKQQELTVLEQTQSMEELRLREASRSQEWLEQYGTCGDHIRAGPSTLEQAGRGAFANRDLPRGTIMAHAPLIHLVDRSRLSMYDIVSGEERPPQLLLNYCFGHNESSLLLCPYGPMVTYINHNQSLANVKIQWADPKMGNFFPRLLNESLYALNWDPRAKTAFDFVATRPIQEGEEIFLDYGDEWEHAWQKHVEDWAPVNGAAEYECADDLNAAMASGELELLTEFERLRRNLPGLPPNVDLECNDFFSDNLWITLAEEGILDQEMEAYESKAQHWHCYILRTEKSANNGEILYTVEARNDDDTASRIWENAPRAMFKFFDKPYTSDIFLENAFRHHIGIPDKMIPDTWRNLSPDFEGKFTTDDYEKK